MVSSEVIRSARHFARSLHAALRPGREPGRQVCCQLTLGDGPPDRPWRPPRRADPALVPIVPQASVVVVHLVAGSHPDGVPVIERIRWPPLRRRNPVLRVQVANAFVHKCIALRPLNQADAVAVSTRSQRASAMKPTPGLSGK
jgi:hypothetical protein